LLSSCTNPINIEVYLFAMSGIEDKNLWRIDYHISYLHTWEDIFKFLTITSYTFLCILDF
jgi:hypothetical protein